MIDLRNKGLPETIEVNGKPYLLNTDFRYWLQFAELIKKPDVKLNELYFLFKDKNPHDDLSLIDMLSEEKVDFSDKLYDFFMNPNATPKGTGGNERIVDYILDGEYIVGSFMQIYGIDLTECDMHWHKFKALFLSLPENCKIREIMGYRSWEEKEEKYKTIARRLKNDWELPKIKINQKLLDAINDELYNCF